MCAFTNTTVIIMFTHLYRLTCSPTLHSTIISPVSGPSSAPSVKYPVMRATSLSGGVDAELNLSILENATTSQPILQHSTGCESVLQAIQSLDQKITNLGSGKCQ